MAAVYKAIVTTTEESKVVQASSPTALGTEIGKLIQADERDDVTVMYTVSGPLSRRMTEDLASK